MKKTANKTDELLAKLGASLKGSPLASHARQTGTPSSPATAQRAGEETPREKKQNPQLWQTGGASLPGVKTSSGHEPSEDKSHVRGKDQGANDTGDYARSPGSVEIVAKKVVAAAERAIAPAVAGLLEEPTMAHAGTGGIPQKKSAGFDWAESFLETPAKTHAPLNKEQTLGLKRLKEKESSAAQKEVFEKTLQEMGVPLSEEQAQRIKEIQTLRDVLEEIRQLQKDGTSTPPSQAAAFTAAAPVASGSMRHTASGWKTSTVGLYPEDYQKAYAAMQYLTAQTGQPANLSRVVKIALRALEIGPRLLEVNTQVRQRDRRVVRAG